MVSISCSMRRCPTIASGNSLSKYLPELVNTSALKRKASLIAVHTCVYPYLESMVSENGRSNFYQRRGIEIDCGKWLSTFVSTNGLNYHIKNRISQIVPTRSLTNVVSTIISEMAACNFLHTIVNKSVARKCVKHLSPKKG